MTHTKPPRLTTFDLVEAFQLSRAVSALHDANVLASLRQPLTADSLAKQHRLDSRLLRGVLEYIAARTDLLRKIGSRFVLTREYSTASRFLLDLYAGAYGGNASRLEQLLRNPRLAGGAVDRRRHARAIDEGSRVAFTPFAGLLSQLQFRSILDLGCGAAGMLVELAVKDPEFVGWGVEVNPAACRAARARIRSAGAGRRVTIFQGDSIDLPRILPPAVRARIQAVTAVQVANEMFGHGATRAIQWLRTLRKVLPGRPLFLSDYYSLLLGDKTRSPKSTPNRRETLLHDYVQVISGQGVPPATLRDWRRIYAEAGCRLASVIHDRSTTRFVHIVVL